MGKARGSHGVRVFLLTLLLAACSTGFDQTGKDPSNVQSDSGTDDTGGGDTDTGGADTDTGGGDTDTGGGDTDTAPTPVDHDGDGAYSDVDCDDDDASVYPGAPELCDGKDNDCDGYSGDEGDSDTDGTLDCEDYCPVYALPGATGDGRIKDPVGTIQEAVDLAAASGCNEVRANQGTYYENVDWGGSAVNAESLGGPTNTIIDGGSVASVVSFVTGETSAARIYGFTLTHGGGGSGAGVNINASSPTIEGNVITGNDAATDSFLGGGMRIYNGSPTVIDNDITHNNAGFGGPEDGSDGGGIDIRGGAPWIEGNFIAYNTAGDGGGIWTAYSDATIVHNWIVGNAVDDEATELEPDKGGQGGGIDVQIGGATGTVVANNIITDNTASVIGGGVVVYEYNSGYPTILIEQNVIAFNTVTGIVDGDTEVRGSGFAQWSSTVPDVFDNILYMNHGNGAYAEEVTDGFTYNDVFGNDENYGGIQDGTGTGNLSVDPKFKSATDDGNPENDDYTLTGGSGCIDAGDPALTDPDGSRADLGVYGGPEGSW